MLSYIYYYHHRLFSNVQQLLQIKIHLKARIKECTSTYRLEFLLSLFTLFLKQIVFPEERKGRQLHTKCIHKKHQDKHNNQFLKAKIAQIRFLIRFVLDLVLVLQQMQNRKSFSTHIILGKPQSNTGEYPRYKLF